MHSIEGDALYKQLKYSTRELSKNIYIYKEETAALVVFTTSVFCLRKPEAIRKTTRELLLAEWWTIFAWVMWGVHYRVGPSHTLTKLWICMFCPALIVKNYFEKRTFIWVSLLFWPNIFFKLIFPILYLGELQTTCKCWTPKIHLPYCTMNTRYQ